MHCSVPARRRRAAVPCKRVWKCVMWKEGVCTSAQRWNMYVTGLRTKERKESRLWKEIPPSPDRPFSQMLPRSFVTQVLPRSWHKWHQLFSGPEGSALQGQPSLAEMNLHGRKVRALHSLFYHTRTTLWFPHIYITALRCVFPSPPPPIHKYTSARRHSASATLSL